MDFKVTRSQPNYTLENLGGNIFWKNTVHPSSKVAHTGRIYDILVTEAVGGLFWNNPD